jgi:hypothetical protein
MIIFRKDKVIDKLEMQEAARAMGAGERAT